MFHYLRDSVSLPNVVFSVIYKITFPRQKLNLLYLRYNTSPPNAVFSVIYEMLPQQLFLCYLQDVFLPNPIFSFTRQTQSFWLFTNNTSLPNIEFFVTYETASPPNVVFAVIYKTTLPRQTQNFWSFYIFIVIHSGSYYTSPE